MEWFLQFWLLIRTFIFLKCCPLQLIWFQSYFWSRWRSLGNSFNAFCVVTSVTSSTEIPFTWAIYSAEMEMFWGSFRTCFWGPRAGESVSKQIEVKGNCFTSFCFLERKEKASKFKTWEIRILKKGAWKQYANAFYSSRT